MEILTTRFGKITIKDQDVLVVKDGVLGFESHEKYVILEHDSEETSPFKWLQSVENPDLAFVVMDPRLIVVDYQLMIDDETIAKLGDDRFEEIIPMVIVNIPQDNPQNMTANLRGPILIHAETKQGCQIVLSNESYAFDHLIFPEQAKQEPVQA